MLSGCDPSHGTVYRSTREGFCMAVIVTDKKQLAHISSVHNPATSRNRAESTSTCESLSLAALPAKDDSVLIGIT